MQDDLPPTPQAPPPPPPPRAMGRRPIAAASVADDPPPMSSLAVVAFILGLAGVCPLAGLPAIVLGFVAHARIVRGQRRLRGRGLALWAVALGSATSLAWLGLWNHVGSRMLEVLSGRMETAIATTMAGAAAGDADAVLAAFDGPAIDRDEVRVLMMQVSAAGVAPESISVTRFEQVESGMTPLVAADVRIRMEDGEIWNGEVSFRLRPPPYRGLAIEDLTAEPRLVAMFLRGPEGRALRYPTPAAPSSPTSPTSPTSPDAASEPVPPERSPSISP